MGPGAAAQIAAFGGDKRFTPAFVPSDQCTRNCSFPAGDPAVGFVFVAARVPGAGAARGAARAVAGALALGGVIGVARIAQGGHFLSDVIASGFLVFATTWLLYRWIVVADGLPALLRASASPAAGAARFAALGVVTALRGGGVDRLDRPAACAIFPRQRSRGIATSSGVITSFGVSTGYLVAAAILALGLRAGRAPPCAGASAGAGCASMPGAPPSSSSRSPAPGSPATSSSRSSAAPGRRCGSTSGIFGFTWHGAHAAYWSFPSGHTITIVALAAALAQIERRGLPLYVAAALLVAASRLVLDQHYLSDVFAGAFIAGAGAAGRARAGFVRAGIAWLSDSP